MSARHPFTLLTLLALTAGFLAPAAARAGDEDDPKEPPKNAAPVRPEPPSRGKPPSKEAQKGIKFLADTQNPDGGWGAGSRDPFGGGLPAFPAPGGGGKPRAAPKPAGPGGSSDVGATSIAALAIMRAGHSPRQGPHAGQLRKAIDFVLDEVEKSDKGSLQVTDIQGTQIQGKIGKNADTFLAGMMLAQARGRMPDARSEARLKAALTKIVDKMEANQKPDGSWAGEGWAPVLSQALASRALNHAKQVGIGVDAEALERTAQHARDNFKKFADGGGDGGAAGVNLYAAAAHIGALHDAVTTYRMLGDKAKNVLRSPELKDEERKIANTQIGRLGEAEKALRQALEVIVKKAKDPAFVRGFGSDGGEEFISFMLISEALKLNNRKEYPEWEKAIVSRLQSSQNGSGSWSGKHCITGETFCTAASALTIMADRSGPLTPEDPLGRVAGPGTPARPRPKVEERNDLPDLRNPAAVADASKMASALVKASGKNFDALLDKYRDAKGGIHTEALAAAANAAEGEVRKQIREALAFRLARMTPRTVRQSLADPEAEIRRAAALACAIKDDKNYVPDLIPVLAEPGGSLAPAARAALKQLTGQDFGPESAATPAQKAKAIQAWRDWWSSQQRSGR